MTFRLDRVYGTLLRGFVGSILLFITLPMIVIIVVSFSAGEFLIFPPEELSLRWYFAYFQSQEWLYATQTSVQIAAGATLISTTLGVGAAFAIDRYEFKFSKILGMSYVLPIMLPPIVISVAFLTFFYTIGLAGTVWGVLIAHGVFFAPFPFVLVSQGLSELDQGFEEASMTLGGGPFTTFRRVTFPLIRANVAAGAIFTFILSMNEYVIAWILAGFSISTIPIQIFSSLRYSYSPIIASVSVVIIFVTIVLTVILDYMTGGIWE